MLSREERLEFCTRCTHRKETKRYGTICGLTDNYPHFSETCEHFVKEASFKPQEHPFKGVNYPGKKELARKKSKFSLIKIAFIIYIIFKIFYRYLRRYM